MQNKQIMKTIISNFKKLFVLSFLFHFNLYAQDINITGKLTQANVFIQGAQLFHSAPVKIPAGTHVINLEGISPFIIANSIQAGGKGDFLIIDVAHFIKYPEPEKNVDAQNLPLHIKKEIKQLTDSLEMMKFDFDIIQEKRNLLLAQKNIMNGNKLYKGEGKSDSLTLFMAAMEFYNKKMSDLNTELIKLKKEEFRLNEKKAKQEARLFDLNNYSVNQPKTPLKSNDPVHMIKLTVMAETPIIGSVQVNYFINNASWIPEYDLRAINTESPVKLTYKAQIQQSSGLDWNDIKLILSTSNPQKGNHKPVLNPWYLSFYNPYQYKSLDSRAPMQQAAKLEERKSRVDDQFDADIMANHSELIENLVNFQYEIKVPYKINSDGKTHAIMIMQKEVSTQYDYVVVPKIDTDAFIMARISGWENLNLMSGKANIYFENMYVGETYLNAQITSDTLSVALGRDNNVQVQRKKLKTNEREKFLNNEKITNYAYEIVVKNAKSNPIKITIEDQIPISNNQQIKVDLVDAGKADVNLENGMMTWKISLKPKESKTYKYAFNIRHDKDKQISQLP